MKNFIVQNLTIILINLVAIILLIVSIIKNKEKTKKSLKVAIRTLVKIAPLMVIIIILIGFLSGLLPSDIISNILGVQSGFLGVLITALLGSVLYIPAIISFPLAASFLETGASVSSVAAFITTLTMVGVVTLPLEAREMGKKFTILRNMFSFLLAIVIAVIMGAIL